MRAGFTHNLLRMGVICTSLFVCVVSGQTLAAESGVPASILAGGEQTDAPPFPLVLDQGATGFSFDLGGSETRKLQLQLDQPITLTTGSHARVVDGSNSMLGLDATLNVPVANGFSLTGSSGVQTGSASFQSLGSIQCMNGILTPDSYTAAGCRFVNEPYSTLDRQQFKLGGRYETAGASASINWFTQNMELNQPGPARASMNNNLVTPLLNNSMLPGTQFGEPLQYLNSKVSGIDLNFRVGITTNNSGDIRLGLSLTRMLDTGYQGIYSNGPDVLDWTVAEPFNTARMNIEWSRGSFSSGIQGFYREPVNFLDRNNLDSMATFDVHFTWRTPWNANLSVGASNVLNSGVNDNTANENQPVDPFESIYGRIPYVRYKQDL